MNDRSKKYGIFTSILLHLICIYYLLYSSSSSHKIQQKQYDTIKVKIASIRDNVNLKKDQKKTLKKKITKKKSSKPKKIKKSKQKKQLTKKKQIENKNSKKNKEVPDPMDSILKDLEESSKIQQKKSNKNKYDYFDDYDENLPLSITEEVVIKNQISQHWRKPIGIKNLDQIKILINIKLKRDGNLESLVVKNVTCPLTNKEICIFIQDSALRAVRSAIPIQLLSVDRYDSWKEIDLLFEPEMFNK